MEQLSRRSECSDSDSDSYESSQLTARSEEPGGLPTPREPPKRRPLVPGLNLGAQKPLDSPKPASTRSPSKRKLAGPLPTPPSTASSSLGGGGGPEGIGGASTRRSAAQQSATAFAVELLSDALVLHSSNLAGDSSRLEAAQKRVVSQLGVHPSELTFYELREVRKEEDLSTPQCRRVAVKVAGSGFSMAAIEQLLSQKQHLEEETARALAAAEGRGRQAQQSLASVQLRLAEQESETEQLRLRCLQLETTSEALRQQVQRSEAGRKEGQRALDLLRSEFETLTRDLTGGEPVSSPLKKALPSNWPGQGSSALVLGGDEGGRSQARIANALERLGDESVLSRLESCLRRLECSP